MKGQNIIESKTKKIYGDTTKYYKIYNGYSKEMKLFDLLHSNSDLDFRIWNNGRLIQVSIRNDSIAGELIIYALYRKNSKQTERELRFNVYSIKTEDLEWIKENFEPKLSELKQLHNSNTMEYVERDGGVTELIEISNKGNYIFSTYFNHTDKPFIDSLFDRVDSDKKKKDFIDREIRKGCYSFGGTAEICKK